MKPDLSRSDQVVARVVAWHNRHPLARKITADQVHSVGVVSLPFAVRGARVEPISLALPAQPVPSTPIVIELPTPPAAELAPPAADGDDQTVVELVVDPPPEAPPAPPPAEAATVAPAPPETAAPAGDLPRVTVLAMRAAQLPPRPRAWHPLTWWQALRRRPTFRPLFSEDFIAPLRPRQVARWAAAHGVGARPLEPQAQERLIMLDTTRRRDGDAAPEVDLYLITAAIGAGDERKRLLLSPGSSGLVWGPRYWDRPRLAAATGSALALLALLVTGLLGRADAVELLALLRPGKPEPAASAPLAASTPASASRHALRPASAPVALAAASAPSAAATHATSDDAAQPQAVVATASAATASAPTRAASQPPVQVAQALAPVAAAEPEPASEPAEAPPRPESVPPRRGRISIQPLVPRLSDPDRQVLRAEARLLRGPVADGAAAEAKVKAWALVTRPIGDRRQSERLAAQMQAVALLQPVPMRADLMQAGQGWRAAVWPFQSAKDAEKVRLALADKGLRTELVEF